MSKSNDKKDSSGHGAGSSHEAAWPKGIRRFGYIPSRSDFVVTKDDELFKDPFDLGLEKLNSATLTQMEAAFLDELNKIAHTKQANDLTALGRSHVAEKNFAVSAEDSPTGKPAYPIQDTAHAANALARVKQYGSPELRAKVYAAVAKKYPDLALRSEVPGVRDRAKAASAATAPGIGHAIKNEALELGGLGILAVPALDKLQARLRADTPEEAEHKQLLSEKGHAVAELGGLGALAGDTIWKELKKVKK